MGKKKKQQSLYEEISIHNSIEYDLTRLYEANQELLEFIPRSSLISIDEFNGLPKTLERLNLSDNSEYYYINGSCGGEYVRKSYRTCASNTVSNIRKMYERVYDILEDIADQIEDLEEKQQLPMERRYRLYYDIASQKYRNIHKSCRQCLFAITDIDEANIASIIDTLIELIKDAAKFNLTIMDLESGEEGV